MLIACTECFYFMSFAESCSPGIEPVSCTRNPCDHQTCPQYPDAECVPDRCGHCQAKFYVEDREVTDECGRSKVVKL